MELTTIIVMVTSSHYSSRKVAPRKCSRLRQDALRLLTCYYNNQEKEHSRKEQIVIKMVSIFT